MAQLAKTAYPWIWYDQFLALQTANKAGIFPEVDWDREIKEESAALEKLQETSDKLKPGEIVGGLLRFPVCDGSAFYVVTKEKPLTIQWVPYSDRWSINPMTLRGMKKADVLQLLERARSLRKK